METSRKSFYWIIGIAVFIPASLLIIFLILRQRINQPVLIGQEQAIQNAIQACNPVYGLQPVEKPTEIEAHLATYIEATGNESPYKNVDSESLVWVVDMKGKWLVVGGPPTEEPSNGEPAYWDKCTIIIDAQTGESLSTPIE